MGATECCCRNELRCATRSTSTDRSADPLRGWTTLDLAAHLVAREARSDAALGLVIPPLAGHLQKVMDKYSPGYEPLVAMLRTGPPWMHRTGPLATANVNENFVHHEDVRRASGETPRTISPEMDAILWKMLGFGARMSKKRCGAPRSSWQTPDGRERVVSTDGGPVTLSGLPGELTLFMSGRKEAAEITLDGDATAIAIVRAANFGV